MRVTAKVYCRIYPTDSSSSSRSGGNSSNSHSGGAVGGGNEKSSCTDPQYDVSRYKASRINFVLALDISAATVNDTGLYVCVEPQIGHLRPPIAFLGQVGVISEYDCQPNSGARECQIIS